MMKHTSKLATLRCGLLVVSSSLMSGCFEMNYPDKETYYRSLGNDVEIIKTDKNGVASSLETVSIEEKLFNDDSVNDIHSADSLESNYYEYIVIKFTEDMNIGDFALYIKADTSVNFTIRLFVVDNAPIATAVRSFMLPNLPVNIYTDTFVDPVGELSLSANELVWESFYLNTWNNKVDSKFTKIEKGEYFIIQFLNNTGYGADIGLKPVSFIPINLIISPVKEN